MLTIAAVIAAVSLSSIVVPVPECRLVVNAPATLDELAGRAWTIADVEVLDRRVTSRTGLAFDARVVTALTRDIQSGTNVTFFDTTGDDHDIQPGTRYVVFLNWNAYLKERVLFLRELTFLVDYDDRIKALSSLPLAMEQEGKTRSAFLRELRESADRARRKPR